MLRYVNNITKVRVKINNTVLTTSLQSCSLEMLRIMILSLSMGVDGK